MSAIDDVLWLLKDGRWHNSREVMEKCSIPNSVAKMIVRFLWKYGLIEIDKNRQRAKLCPLMLEFMCEIQQLEREFLSHEGFEGLVGVEKFEPFRCCLEKT